MKILSISVSHEANAALAIDGQIVAAAAEERFTRLKMDMRYPKLAIDFCLKSAGIEPSQLDYVVLVTEDDDPTQYMVNRIATFSVDDFVREQHQYWKPRLLENKEVNYLSVFSDKIFENYYDMSIFMKETMSPEKRSELYLDMRKNAIIRHLDVDPFKIKTVKHERSHSYYGYYANHLRGRVLVITMEGAGEYSNSTISIFEDNNLKEISNTKENHIGHLYKFITLLLGMKPSQHEYKVMGLAPYANTKEVEKANRVFQNLFEIDGLNIRLKERPQDFYFWFLKKLEGCRFDGIAGALQKTVEDITVKMVKHCCEELDVSNVVLSGGVAQNIKACQSIGEIENVKNLCVAPTSGDGSLSIGGCYYMIDRICEQNGIEKNSIKPLESVYLGPEYSKDEIDNAISKHDLSGKYRLAKNITDDFIVEHLCQDKVIARFSGKMEFGQRALGNRSIIANPSNIKMIRKLNTKIKFRDFWMPFTPTILDSHENRYIINPKQLRSPFMTLAFNTTELFQEKAPAAIHPADDTARPQILERTHNPKYYDLIKAFEQRTGIGALLNTSMNLHGEPMVCSPDDAIHTFLNSEIDVLLFDHIAIMRDSDKNPLNV
ncbi:MAG: carbamoyltransferase [Nitrospirae bacterium]|nr:carbamoyltransferase [Nitrospirota bacterium]